MSSIATLYVERTLFNSLTWGEFRSSEFFYLLGALAFGLVMLARSSKIGAKIENDLLVSYGPVHRFEISPDPDGVEVEVFFKESIFPVRQLRWAKGWGHRCGLEPLTRDDLVRAGFMGSLGEAGWIAPPEPTV